MITCHDIDMNWTDAGVHECVLKANEPGLFPCNGRPNCWAFDMRIMADKGFICDVRDMSITISGALLPVEVTNDESGWEMSLKEWPPHDAIVHWMVVPCKPIS